MQSQLKQKEIAKFLSVSPGKIKELTKDGMPHVILGVTPRYNPTEVLIWLKELTKNIYTQNFHFELEKLKVGSCTCCTTTPDISYHVPTCMYRKIQELINKI